MAAFKDMTFKEKIEHIIYYYKWHIIFGIVILVFSINIFQSILEADKNIPLMTFSLQGGEFVDYQKKEDWEKKFSEKIVKEEDIGRTVRVDFYPINTEEPNEATNISIQKLATYSAVGELDIICLNEDYYIEQMKIGAFLPIDTIDKLSSVIEENKDKIVTYVLEDGQKESHIYGIRADDIKIFKELEYDVTGKIIGISSGTKRIDYTVEAFKLVFE
ncbi:MAG TPA: hypothetical protein PKK61_13650 [Defluviitaleaceae bacterium]|nr:hypothetical protein [Candidatus Epulonipiscium sp.]HOA82086.1 hypothetical protein [Defluviitaleaceae bacterium]